MMRFFVDERGGCIAVRDRMNTDPEYNGLHEETVGVIKYWWGFQVHDTCPTCKQKSFNGWAIKDSDRFEAYELCEALNTQYEGTK